MTPADPLIRARCEKWVADLVTKSGGSDYYYEGWTNETDLLAALVAFVQAERHAEARACLDIIKGEHSDMKDCSEDACDYQCMTRNAVALLLEQRIAEGGISE